MLSEEKTRRSRHRALAGACTAALAWADAGVAQDQAPEMRGTITIEVTGSHIKRTEAEGPLPIQVITREEINRAGWTTAAELMSHVAANLNGFNDQLSIGQANVPGLAGVNLRGLGDQYTLVLLNGRRIANYAFGAFAIDLSAIPFAAIERVEILRDGASSIYGADAIAGVVNFILRKDYRGVEVSGQISTPEHAGGQQYQATITAGIGDLAKDRYNAFVNFDWQKSLAVRATDREFAKTGYRPEQGLVAVSTGGTFPGGIQLFDGDSFGGNLYPSAATGCKPPLSLPIVRSGETTCVFDSRAMVDLLPPVETISLLAHGTLQIAPDHQLFAEYSYARRDLDLRIAPTPISRFSTADFSPIRYPVGGPYYPTQFAAQNGLAGDLDVIFRATELGQRIDEVRTDAQRLLIGAEGRFGDWDYNTAYDHSVSKSTDTPARGYISASALISAMQTGLINPFGPSAPEGQALLASTQVPEDSRNAKSTLDQADFRVSTHFGEMAGGPIGFAAGVEARKEKLDDRPTALQETGDVLSDPFQIPPVNASRRAEAIYAEANLPLLASVEAQLAARYDHYSDFGGTTNPKIALRWQPVRSVLLRGGWGTGFHAPTLTDLHTAQTGAFTEPLDDPIRCPVTGSEQDCFVSYPALQGGNPSLKPERSTQYTFGAVWEPVTGTSASIQYWSIKIRDAIASLDAATIFDNYAALGAGNVVRGPVDPQNPDLPGPITLVNTYEINVGTLETAGFDLDLRTRLPMTSIGRFSIRFDGTYLTKSRQNINGLPEQSTLGMYGVLGPVPRWRHYVAFDWERGPWNATLAQTYQYGYTDVNPLPDGSERRVGSYSVWDIQGSYAGVRNLTVTLGIKNLFDRDPPFSNQPFTQQAGYDPSYADPRGRTYYARLAYAFK
jgi:iron complex outermembrane recepter protein